MRTFVKKHLSTFLGIAGFIFGTLLILCTGLGTFHEIQYQPREILHTILHDPDAIRNIPKGDTILAREIGYRDTLLRNLSDSMAEKQLFANQLFINKDDFNARKMLDYAKAVPKGIGCTKPVQWDYYISYSLLLQKPITPYHIGASASLCTAEYSYVSFFTKYPAFVLWMLLIVVQFPLFVFLGLFAFSEIIKFKKLIATRMHLDLKDKVIASLLIVFSFVILSFLTFFKGHPIMGGLFCTKEYIMLLFGLLLLFASLCGTASFTGFMLITEYSARIYREVLKPDLDASDGTPDKPDAEKFNALNRLFNRMLICASLALSVIVLTTGVLFSGLNSMEFIQKVTKDFGHSPVAYHFVFLIGILCSGLILLFFFPAKIQLMNLQKAYLARDPEGKGLDKSEDILTLLKTGFTVGLPALIPVLHFIINLFINGK